VPWRERRKVEERMRFVARLLDGEKMAVLCREFDISRKTGYKLFNRSTDVRIQPPFGGGFAGGFARIDPKLSKLKQLVMFRIRWLHGLSNSVLCAMTTQTASSDDSVPMNQGHFSVSSGSRRSLPF
jgi:hypothetical protein